MISEDAIHTSAVDQFGVPVLPLMEQMAHRNDGRRARHRQIALIEINRRFDEAAVLDREGRR